MKLIDPDRLIRKANRTGETQLKHIAWKLKQKEVTNALKCAIICESTKIGEQLTLGGCYEDFSNTGYSSV